MGSVLSCFPTRFGDSISRTWSAHTAGILSPLSRKRPATIEPVKEALQRLKWAVSQLARLRLGRG